MPCVLWLTLTHSDIASEVSSYHLMGCMNFFFAKSLPKQWLSAASWQMVHVCTVHTWLLRSYTVVNYLSSPNEIQEFQPGFRSGPLSCWNAFVWFTAWAKWCRGKKKKSDANLTFALAVCLDQYLPENLDKKNGFAIFCLCDGEL